MTLLQALRKRWAVAAALLVLTLIATVAALVELPWTYTATSDVLLLPSQSSAKLVGGNRYLAFSFPVTQTANVLTYQIGSAITAQQLAAAGYTSGYTVTNAPNATAPVLLVTVVGSNKDMVEHTLTGVTQKIAVLLAAEQQGLDGPNAITAQTVSFDQQPTRLSNKKARPLIVVFGVGIVLTLAVPSVIESSARRRRSSEFDASKRKADSTDERPGRPDPRYAQERRAAPQDARAMPEYRQQPRRGDNGPYQPDANATAAVSRSNGGSQPLGRPR